MVAAIEHRCPGRKLRANTSCELFIQRSSSDSSVGGSGIIISGTRIREANNDLQFQAARQS